MSALKSLALAIELATRKRDAADQALMQARRAVQHAQDQLEQLQSYAGESEARWATANAATVSAEIMQHQQHFMQRLRHAIGLQDGVLADLQRQAEAARQRRLQEEVRLAALEQLLKKKVAERSRLAARREQKQMDDLAALKYARAAATGGSPMNGERA